MENLSYSQGGYMHFCIKEGPKDDGPGPPLHLLCIDGHKPFVIRIEKVFDGKIEKLETNGTRTELKISRSRFGERDRDSEKAFTFKAGECLFKALVPKAHLDRLYVTMGNVANEDV